MHITFICTGNTCRSPMAEGIAHHLLAQSCPDGHITVSSAGLQTCNGSPATQQAIDACREIGIDLMSHRSRRLTQELADRTDLFAVMTPSHAAFLRRCGVAEHQIAILGSGIPDPYGRDIEVYRQCRDALQQAVEALLASVTASEASDTPDGGTPHE